MTFVRLPPWTRASLILLALLASREATARSLFLNGTDISSARSQELKNVNIVINEKGDIFVIAPHYQVNEEDTYIPLSKYVKGQQTGLQQHPAHKAKDSLPSHPGALSATDGQIMKMGEKAGGGDIPASSSENSIQDKPE